MSLVRELPINPRTNFFYNSGVASYKNQEARDRMAYERKRSSWLNSALSFGGDVADVALNYYGGRYYRTTRRATRSFRPFYSRLAAGLASAYYKRKQSRRFARAFAGLRGRYPGTFRASSPRRRGRLSPGSRSTARFLDMWRAS